jgi:hypothetical protein
MNNPRPFDKSAGETPADLPLNITLTNVYYLATTKHKWQTK